MSTRRKFNEFTQETSAVDTDVLVGYGATSAGNPKEARWTFAELKRAVLGQTTASPIQVQVAASVNRADGTRYLSGAWYNVRSVTDDSKSRKTINFTTPLPSNNYIVIANPIGGKTDTQLNYEVKPVVKARDKVTIYHVTEHWLDREPAFDLLVLQ